MKTPTSRRQDGFTLVELLVVIAIIAVLAGAGFAAGSAAIQKAKKVTALATVVGLESAVNSFYTEYGSMPTTVSTSGDADAPELNTKTDKDFLKIVLGMTETTTPAMNTRSVKFLSVKEGKKKGASDGTNGIVYNASGTEIIGLFDPWGGTYKLKMDTGYDDKLKVKPKGDGSIEVTLNGRKSAAWSDGADGVDPNVGKAADDVKNW